MNRLSRCNGVPARSLYLTPLDFFVWSYIKSQMYTTNPDLLNELRQRITDICARISPDTFHNVREEFLSRMLIYQERQGGHFLHLLK